MNWLLPQFDATDSNRKQRDGRKTIALKADLVGGKRGRRAVAQQPARVACLEIPAAQLTPRRVRMKLAAERFFKFR